MDLCAKCDPSVWTRETSHVGKQSKYGGKKEEYDETEALKDREPLAEVVPHNPEKNGPQEDGLF